MIAFLKSKTGIIAIIILIVVLVIVGAYLAGKSKKNKYAPKHKPLPTGGEGIPIVGTDTKGAPIPWNPTPLAKELYDVMDGVWTPLIKKDNAFAKLSALTDDQITAVYNRFNDLYYSEDDATLTEWIDDEWNSGNAAVQALSRLKNLNLSYAGSPNNANWGVNNNQFGNCACAKCAQGFPCDASKKIIGFDSYDLSINQAKQLQASKDMDNFRRSQEMMARVSNRMHELGLVA